MDKHALEVTEIAEFVRFDFVFFGFGVVDVAPAGAESPGAFNDALLADEVGCLNGIGFVGGAGLLMAAVLVVRRMEEISHVHLLTPENDPEFDGSFSLRGKTVPEGVILFRFHGPFFFAVADKLEVALRGSGGRPRAVVFRMRYVPSMDATGLQAFRTAVEKLRRDGVIIYVTGIQPQPMSVLHKSGVADLIGIENFCGNIDEALEKGRKLGAA